MIVFLMLFFLRGRNNIAFSNVLVPRLSKYLYYSVIHIEQKALIILELRAISNNKTVATIIQNRIRSSINRVL